MRIIAYLTFMILIFPGCVFRDKEDMKNIFPIEILFLKPGDLGESIDDLADRYVKVLIRENKMYQIELEEKHIEPEPKSGKYIPVYADYKKETIIVTDDEFSEIHNLSARLHELNTAFDHRYLSDSWRIRISLNGKTYWAYYRRMPEGPELPNAPLHAREKREALSLIEKLVDIVMGISPLKIELREWA
uniref:Uncharacterized protein n=1 Tax=Candidatus Kentrum sp. LPFa TaxID=2126335 RepID=A0A450X1F5_9GAMM|nr:MAG: hypothetical protein BECKLPF1236B_GA0070989_13412 [Candidatus Kentron sp. LPFa]